jgi:hypothetical protein
VAIFAACAVAVGLRVVVPDVWKSNWVSHLGWRGGEISEVVAADVGWDEVSFFCKTFVGST